MPLIFLASETTVFIILAIVTIVMILFFAVVFTAMYFFIKRKERDDGKKWANIARQFNLQIQPATDEMLSDFDRMRNRMGGNAKIENVTTAQPLVGNFNNRLVRIIIHGKRTSKEALSSTMLETYDRVQTIEFTTHCEAAISNGFDFLIISKNYANFISRANDGGSVLQIGFPNFDQNFIVRGDNQRIPNLLCAKSNDNRTVAERFAAHLNKDWVIEASGGKVAVKMPGKVFDVSRLNAALNAATELAMRIETALAQTVKI